MKSIKSAFLVILVALLVLSQIACSNSSKQAAGQDGNVVPKPDGEETTLTIMVSAYEYNYLAGTKPFIDYTYKFEKDFGVDVKYEKIGSIPGEYLTQKDSDEFLKKLSTKLYAEEGPELIFSVYSNVEPLIVQGAVAKLNDKVPNIKNVYSGLLDDEVCFVPVGINFPFILFDLEALTTNGYKVPEMNWTSKDLFDLRTKWLEENSIYFNSHEWGRVFDAIIDLDKLYDSKSNKFTLDTPETRQAIKDVRSYIFNGNYIINKNHKFEDYYNMFFEINSPEFIENGELFDKNREAGFFDIGSASNLLKAIDEETAHKNGGTIAMPIFSDEEVILDATTFGINKNGKNLELAYEFINGLLSDEVQKSIYDDDDRYYPASKSIETDILELEAARVKDQRVIDVKEYALNQIKSQKMKLWNTMNIDLINLKSELEKDLATIILADNECSEVEMSAKLREFESKYNIFLNE